jgi:dimethylargininase
MAALTRAIVRKPGANFSQGQTSDSAAVPDMEKVKAQHMDYVWTLFSLGIEPDLLDPDPRYPDSCFVEDVAVLTDQCAVICRPGHASRQGEEVEIEALLKEVFPIERISAPGTVDGGDICRAGDHFFIGLSARTNPEGARQLAEILHRYKYTSQVVPVIEALHLKSGVSWLGGKYLLLTEAYAVRPEFEGFDLIEVAPEEAYAANCLYINGVAVISEGFPKLKETLQQREFGLLEVSMTEFRKMDGSLTCLSLLW